MNMPDTSVDTETDVEVKKPSMYRVVLLNDDFTPMDFVISILQEIFNKSHEKAYEIMMEVHENGRGTAGVYTYEIAYQKAHETISVAKKSKYPLKAEVEKDE